VAKDVGDAGTDDGADNRYSGGIPGVILIEAPGPGPSNEDHGAHEVAESYGDSMRRDAESSELDPWDHSPSEHLESPL
jgi:hypothetical protein